MVLDPFRTAFLLLFFLAFGLCDIIGASLYSTFIELDPFAAIVLCFCVCKDGLEHLAHWRLIHFLLVCIRTVFIYVYV